MDDDMITRRHATASKRVTGVYCVFEDCRAELSYGAFRNHFLVKHLPKLIHDAAIASPEAPPPKWDPSFYMVHCVGKGEPARLAKYGLADVTPVNEQVARLAQRLEEHNALLAKIAVKLGGDLGLEVEPSEEVESEPPTAPITAAPAPTPSTDQPPAEEQETGKKSRKRRTPSAASSPARSSTRRSKNAKDGGVGQEKEIDQALI